MVTLNFTIVLEVGLFLLFLFGMARWVFRPALATLDAREALVERNRASAETALREAESLEDEYRQAVARMRHEADEAVRDARRKALDDLAAQMLEKQREADARIHAIREESARLRETQRADMERLAPELAEAIARQLGVGDGA